MVVGDTTTRVDEAVAWLPGGRGLRALLRSVGAKALAIGLFVGGWQLLYSSGWKPSFVLPSPAMVAVNLWQQLGDALLWEAIATTMSRAVTGFGLAVVIGAVVGAALSRNTLLRSAFGPIITGLQTMPAI
ncbi:ABC transporter permease, partial [Mycobacterium sp. CBMA361]|nr:ABC transporter permease [Mycolicibacterium sp. CBMA 361]